MFPFLRVLNINSLLSSVCTQLSYLASYWNRLYLPENDRTTTSKLDPESSLIRISGSWESLGQVVEMIMMTYSWRHLVVMNNAQLSTSCSQGSNSIISWFSTTHMVSDYSVFNISMSDAPLEGEIDLYLTTAQQFARGTNDEGFLLVLLWLWLKFMFYLHVQSSL